MNVVNDRAVKSAAVELTASGNLVAAVSGKAIVVVGYLLTLDADASVQFQSKPGTGDATDLSGPLDLGAAVVLGAAPNAHGWFKTKVGEALYLVVTGSVNVGGHVAYVEA